MTLAKLRHAISAIHADKAPQIGYSMEELYRAVQSLCIRKRSKMLYKFLQECIQGMRAPRHCKALSPALARALPATGADSRRPLVHVPTNRRLGLPQF